MQPLLVIKEESLPEHQNWNLSVDQDDIKEEEKLWISQQGEQLQQLEEADLTKFGLTVVPVKSENDEEKPEAEPVASSSSVHTTLTAEDDGVDDGGPQAARNSGPNSHLQPDTSGRSSDSSGSETDDSSDWEQTGELQSSFNCRKNNNILHSVFDIMPLRKQEAAVKTSTTGHVHGRVRGAAAQGAGESAPVTEDVPAPSESETESTSPPPGSLIDTITKVLQPATQFFFDYDNGLPFSEAAKSQQKRKRELVTADFTEEQEQEMVDWLKAPDHDFLINKKHRNYIKKDIKDNLWEQKAMEMGKSSDQLKKWYSNMRCRFGKLKQNPSGSLNELTARDRWILHHFEFLSPHLIVQVKKRVTVSKKAKVQLRAASTTTAGAPQSESESDAADHHPSTAAQSDTDTSLGCRSRVADDAEPSMSNIAELQRQLKNKLSNSEKSPLQRQKDTFTDFMKEVTYTFPPPMWLRFQSEVSNLLQRYQFELHQMPPMQTHQQ